MSANELSKRGVLAACAIAAVLAWMPAAQAQGAPATAAATEGRSALAQAQQAQRTRQGRRAERSRTRIIVRPRPPASDVRPPTNTVQLYPSPYAANFPGPGYLRFCEDWYEEQHRESGTAIFPRMRCEWRRAAR